MKFLSALASLALLAVGAQATWANCGTASDTAKNLAIVINPENPVCVCVCVCARARAVAGWCCVRTCEGGRHVTAPARCRARAGRRRAVHDRL